LVDDDEPERHEGVLGAQGRALEQQLEELGHRYIASMTSWNSREMADRLTFWVAVSSPSSSSSSLCMSVKRFTVSTWARCSLASSTTPWISSTTSGFSVRSR